MIEFRSTGQKSKEGLACLMSVFNHYFELKGFLTVKDLFEHRYLFLDSTEHIVIVHYEGKLSKEYWVLLDDDNHLHKLFGKFKDYVNYGWTINDIDLNNLDIGFNEPEVEVFDLDENTVQIIERWKPGVDHAEYCYIRIPDAKELNF